MSSNNRRHQHTWLHVIATLRGPDSQRHFAADVWEGVSAAALAAGRMRSVVKGYCCAAVSFCICRRVFACTAVSGVRLANTLSPWCGYYTHIKSIWHNHHSHSLQNLSLGNRSWSVRICAGVIEI